ncbi:MAG: TPM domain-containing protein [Leptospiraceae bacterium]|nr:TPM domain-containing protein [Leptospiraceae bacterium]
MIRLFKHFFSGWFLSRKYFPEKVLSNIEVVIKDSEKRHNGEVVLAIEPSLPASFILSKKPIRERAIEIFSRLHVWDTENNSGILLYLNLADKALEIVADRGISSKIKDDFWRKIINNIQNEFSKSKFERGAILAISELTGILEENFPSDSKDKNELPDKPVIIE